jgi:predicted dienelactone hydrolase
MNRIYLHAIIIILLFDNCTTPKQKVTNNQTNSDYTVKIENVILHDNSRNRIVPVAFYIPDTDKKIKKQQVIIFSHGYYENKGGSNLKYSYLTKFLASKGYFTVSIQHELPTDSLIPKEGVPQIVRRPFWERGADNIQFVIKELKKTNPELDFKHITLIGHSNGADMTALFAQKYSNVAYKIIALDNRRMALPRTNQPKVYSLRSSDQPADEGVLPTDEESKKYDMTITKLSNTIHNNMDDRGNETDHKEITDYVLKFLNDKK